LQKLYIQCIIKTTRDFSAFSPISTCQCACRDYSKTSCFKLYYVKMYVEKIFLN